MRKGRTVSRGSDTRWSTVPQNVSVLALDCVSRIDDEPCRLHKSLVIDDAMICQNGHAIDCAQQLGREWLRLQIVSAGPCAAG
jgi:hypothetical protein